MRFINVLGPIMGLFLFISGGVSFYDFFDAIYPLWPYDYPVNGTVVLVNGVGPLGSSPFTFVNIKVLPFTDLSKDQLAVDDVDTILGYLKTFPDLIGESDDWEYIDGVLEGYRYLLENAVSPRPEIRRDVEIMAQVIRNDKTCLDLGKLIDIRYDCLNHGRRFRFLFIPEWTC